MSGTSDTNFPCTMRENCPLLSPSALGSASPNGSTYKLNQLRRLCLPSKAAVLLVILAVVIGALRAIFTCVFALSAFLVVGGEYIDESLAIFITYLAMTIVVVLYPLSGFLADVVCGRYRVVVISVCIITVSFVFMLGAAALLIVNPYLLPQLWSHTSFVLFVFFIAFFGVTFGVGSIIYTANFVQFGLDQLMEAPSEYLSLFVHWFTWADHVGSAVIGPIAASLLCHNQVTKFVACCAPFVCFISVIVLLLFICRKRQWFRSDPGQQNPYKTVLKVLNFARKHKYPLQRSAFTYCDDERPSRLDFGKQRFGGPFTTEQVEDVKTLMRILLILVCLGPVYVLEVPNSVFGFPLISVHIAHKSQKYCDASWIIIESGCLRYIISAVVFPIYIMVLFSTKREKPKILTRLVIGILLYLSGVLCLLVTDVVGHAQMETNVNDISNPCVFYIKFNNNTDDTLIPLLGLPVASLIPTNIFLGIGPLILYTSSLEFISAQSPHNTLSVDKFICSASIFIKVDLGKPAHERASPCHQLWLWLPPVHLCCFSRWTYSPVLSSKEIQEPGER